MGLVPSRDAWSRAEECASAALEIDPSSADALSARAYVRLFRDWDWGAARRDLEQAAARAPGLPSVHLWQGLFLTLSGDFASARRAIDRGRDIDPLSGAAASLRCAYHELVGQYDLSLACARRLVELRPELSLGHWRLGRGCILMGRNAPGLKALRQAVALSDGGLVMRAQLAWGLAKSGAAAEARRELDALDAAASTTFVSGCQRALVPTALGDLDAAFDRIEESLEERDPWVVFMGIDPLFEPLRRDARFASLSRRVGIPVGAAGKHP
jgi:tetratricopeptide (TPR) repeat protein